MNNKNIDDVFGRRIGLPDSSADERLARLVGIDDTIDRLERVMGLLLLPKSLDEWRKKHHPKASQLFEYVRRKHPLIIISGDVGTGKTELAETIGSRVARKNKAEITLFPLSLSSRGSGLVGEMTNLLTVAFSCVEQEAGSIAKTKDGHYKSGIILLIDEADALAQSRSEGQMHHEDKAGVNALIRGIDSLNRRQLPVAVIMCTNRLSAIDSAVIRRACEVISFHRPNEEYRRRLLQPALAEIGFSQNQIEEFVSITGKNSERDYGFTYSDITQRLFHALVMSAFPDSAIDYEKALSVARDIKPTKPFEDVE